MKRVLALSLICIAVLASTACGSIWGDDNGGQVPDGTLFYTDCPLWIYFVDENGNDRVCLDSLYSIPTAFQLQVPQSTRVSAASSFQKVTFEQGEYYILNNSTNFMREDNELNLLCFQTYLWGKTPYKEFPTYMYQGDDEFILKVSFEYLNQQVSDGVSLTSSWGVRITSVLLNDTEVFKGNENGKVFVVKPSQGEISVRVGGM